MVRISSTGEIIQDGPSSSPRNSQSHQGVRVNSLTSSFSQSAARNSLSSRGFGTIDSIRQDNTAQFAGSYARSVFGGTDQGGGGPTGSSGRGSEIGQMFSAMNQKLIHLGVPRIPIGSIVVEPIILAGLGLSYLVFGARGLIFGGFLFGVHQYNNLRS